MCGFSFILSDCLINDLYEGVDIILNKLQFIHFVVLLWPDCKIEV